MNMIETGASHQGATPIDKDWWRGAVIYQIYPRSFLDTSGDGIGDLAGIAEKIPYIASLGVDAVWISPFFTSPMKDFGYDVSDYLGVDPIFGTLHDFDTLISEAHAHGIKVMIDLVLSHTSDQHPWFMEGRKDRENPKSDWHVWADAKPDGTPPNNWLSIFGGSAWTWDGGRQQYYLHNFLTSQPDLNFHNEDVQQALLDVARFWLDRGVDGFRLDTINFYFCDRQLRNNPPLAPEKRNASIAPAVNPYNHQDHLYDKNRPENLKFLERLRGLMDEYPAIAAVGEVGDAQYGLQLMSDYTEGEKRMHMCYAFDFLAPEPVTPSSIEKVMNRFLQNAPDSWACWAFSNHDVKRHASRWGDHSCDSESYVHMLAGLIMSLRGSICLYQGEELGLTEADIAYDDLQDPYGKQFWPDFKGRDGCRTPMVWDTNQPNAGFTSGTPWLPVPAEHLAHAVSEQDHRVASLLNHYRKFIAFRKTCKPLIKGELLDVEAHGDVLTFMRKHNNETVFCAFNMGGKEQTISAPVGELEALEGHGFSGQMRNDMIELPPHNAFIGQLT